MSHSRRHGFEPDLGPLVLLALALPLGLVYLAILALVHLWLAMRSLLLGGDKNRLPIGAVSLGKRDVGPFFIPKPYTIAAPQRLKHLAIQGPTGSGKTTLLRQLILSDIRNGAGLCVIDPKDDLIDTILPHIPRERENDVILFDATDTERPLGFNPFSGIPPERRSLATSDLISVFRRSFAEAWGHRLEHILTNVVLALLETPGATLLDIPQLLLDRSFSEWVLSHVTNPGVRQFLELEF